MIECTLKVELSINDLRKEDQKGLNTCKSHIEASSYQWNFHFQKIILIHVQWTLNKANMYS